MILPKIWLKRYQSQLDTVSNNREYDTLSKEIEFQQLEIELCEKKIREGQQKIQERQADLAYTQEHKADREKGLVEKRSELDDIMSETRDEEERLKEKALDLEKKIEPRLLASFKRIRKGARNGSVYSLKLIWSAAKSSSNWFFMYSAITLLFRPTVST